jgi:hypothetical protein
MWENDESSRVMVLRVLRYLAQMVDLTAFVPEVRCILSALFKSYRISLRLQNLGEKECIEISTTVEMLRYCIVEVCHYVLRALGTMGGGDAGSGASSQPSTSDTATTATLLCREALNCVASFGVAGLGSHMHLLLPSVLEIVDRQAATMELRLTAIATMHTLAERLKLHDQAPRIMQVDGVLLGLLF